MFPTIITMFSTVSVPDVLSFESFGLTISLEVTKFTTIKTVPNISSYGLPMTFAFTP